MLFRSIDGELFLESLVKYASGPLWAGNPDHHRWVEVLPNVSPNGSGAQQNSNSSASAQANERRKGKVGIRIWTAIRSTPAHIPNNTLVLTEPVMPPGCPTIESGTIFEHSVTGEVYQIYGNRWHRLNLADLCAELGEQGAVLRSLNGSPIPNWKPVKGEVRRFTDKITRRFDGKAWRIHSRKPAPTTRPKRSQPKTKG